MDPLTDTGFSFIHKQESNMYRDGHRAIALLAENGKQRLSIGEIETVLTDDVRY